MGEADQQETSGLPLRFFFSPASTENFSSQSSVESRAFSCRKASFNLVLLVLTAVHLAP